MSIEHMSNAELAALVTDVTGAAVTSAQVQHARRSIINVGLTVQLRALVRYIAEQAGAAERDMLRIFLGRGIDDFTAAELVRVADRVTVAAERHAFAARARHLMGELQDSGMSPDDAWTSAMTSLRRHYTYTAERQLMLRGD